ncbi:hypothetical protein [Limnobacter sp.]|uniref:hypothetical protein n=1 Tax=Limnobacter sp. TaxID=2003368 RepID=UPI002FE1890D
MGHSFVRAFLVCTLTAASTSVFAAPPGLLMTYSFDSLSGKFGQAQETRAKSFTLGATLVGEDYRASVFVPYISLEGPGTLVAGTVTGGSGDTRRSQQGLGDIVATYTQDIVGGIQSKGFAMSATGLVKIASGNEDKGLGTGKTDYGLQADLAYRFNNGFGLTAIVGRQYYGDTPELPLLNGNYTTLGVNFPLGEALFINLNTSQRDELLAGTGKRKERAISAVYALDQTSALQFGYTKGRSTASPDDVFSLSYVSQVE